MTVSVCTGVRACVRACDLQRDRSRITHARQRTGRSGGLSIKRQVPGQMGICVCVRASWMAHRADAGAHARTPVISKCMRMDGW